MKVRVLLSHPLPTEALVFNLFAKTATIQPNSTRVPKALLGSSALRRRPTSIVGEEQPAKRGMWVRYRESVGILTNLESGDIATVMLVDDKLGLNVIEVHVPAAELRQALLKEIPAPRRPTAALAASMGYV